MNNKIDIVNGDIRKLLFHYMIPSTAGMLGTAGLIFLDTMFIGQAIGPIGLAAISIAIPIYSIFNAMSYLIGVGGATILSISSGEGNKDKANNVFSQSIILNLLLSLAFILITVFFVDKLVYLMGASSENAQVVKEYLSIVMPCGIFFMSTNVLNTFSKNDKAPRASMWGMIICSITNIVLDYVLMFPLNMGMKGAAIATVIAALLGTLPSLYHFVFKSEVRFKMVMLNYYMVKRIVKNGLANFITEISIASVILVFNIVVNSLSGSIGVSAYSIIANMALVFTAIFNGIAQAMQPIISENYGAGKHDRIEKVFKISKRIVLCIGTVFFLLGVFFPAQIVMIFSGSDPNLINITSEAIIIYFSAFIFLGINIVNIYYYQSIESPKYSSLLSTLKGIVFIFLGLIILTPILKLNGVWVTVPIAECLTVIVGWIILKRERSLS